MSQHDFNIANQTASATRADLNNAIVALASLSSGTAAPTTTYANMLWYETDTNWLWVRNEADSAWIRFAYFNQTTNQIALEDNTYVVNTAGTQTGLLGDQATATWEAGTGTTQSLVSPANVKSAITALAQGGATTFISKATASNTAEIIFTGFNSSLYDSYQFTIAGITPAYYNRYFTMSFSTDGGSTWVGGENIFAFYLGPNGLSMSLGVIGAHLNRPTLTTKIGAGTTDTGSIYSIIGGYPYSVSGVNNAIRFRMSAFNMVSGEITMYGVKKS